MQVGPKFSPNTARTRHKLNRHVTAVSRIDNIQKEKRHFYLDNFLKLSTFSCSFTELGMRLYCPSCAEIQVLVAHTISGSWPYS